MKTLTAIAIVAVLALPVGANAELIDAGLITQDTATGLEWLDLSETLDLSADAVAGGAGGFLADGWRIAHVQEVDQLFVNAGWDGVDDVETVGTTAHLAVVNNLIGLLGLTFSPTPDFGEGWALTDTPGRVSRPFYEAEGFAAGAGRIACTSIGFALRPGDGTVDFANCGMPSDTTFFFIGVYLVRDSTDFDGDGASNATDNCTLVANADQYDSNGDGFGSLCDPDLDNNGVVNFLDYSSLTAAFLATPALPNWNPDADLNNDGVVNFLDISIFPPFFLMPPGPSGINP